MIVGAGSAGCVLANRLSADPSCSVLLLEAGGRDRSPKVKIPAAFAQQFKTRLDWDFETAPEPGCAGRSLYIPRGRCLGGSSSMNAMLYVRGDASDYDGWREAGCAGWGWDDVLPLFERSENRVQGPAPAHGTGGPLDVVAPRSPRRLTRLAIDAARNHGIPFDPDYNDGHPRGVAPVQVTQRGGRRWSAADAFLRPALDRPNLTVLTRATALAVELEDGRARGVRFARGRRRALARAEHEVILAAGAIGSPQLLMLSGIGDPDGLRRAGLDARVELPAVGRNLQDHPYIVCVWEAPGGGSLLDGERPKALLEFLLRGSGPLTSTVAEAFVYCDSRDPTGDGAGSPDLQLHFAPAYFVDNGFDEHDGHAFTLGPVLVAPRSRGELRLRSADPRAKPILLGNHLSDRADVDALVAGVKLARELVATEPLRSAAGAELFPGGSVATDEEVERDVRARVELLYHPVGTCRMGTGSDAVVDPELRVHGVEGLRVADASIMPTIVRGNTNAPTTMIAERAAELVAAAERPAAATAS